LAVESLAARTLNLHVAPFVERFSTWKLTLFRERCQVLLFLGVGVDVDVSASVGLDVDVPTRC
jgi:hypothetical protein